MRAWIIIGALIIAKAINPDFEYSLFMAASISTICFIGLLADIMEFFEGLS